jgi:choline monooxygenase
VNISSELARASTLPSSYYLDEGVFEREKEQIFGRTWQLVARLDDLARPGDFVPATILDEPIVITTGRDGELHGLLQRVPPPRRPGRSDQRATQVAAVSATTVGHTASMARCAPRRRWRKPRVSTRADFWLLPVRVDGGGRSCFANLDDTAPAAARRSWGRIPAEVARAGYDVEHMRLSSAAST